MVISSRRTFNGDGGSAAAPVGAEAAVAAVAGLAGVASAAVACPCRRCRCRGLHAYTLDWYAPNVGQGRVPECTLEEEEKQEEEEEEEEEDIQVLAKAKDKDFEAFQANLQQAVLQNTSCLLYTSPSPRDRQKSRMPSSA